MNTFNENFFTEQNSFTENPKSDLPLVTFKTSEIDNAVTLQLQNHIQTNDGIENNAPMINYVCQTIFNAIDKQASDIHFEPYEKVMRIRLRIDGLLYESANITIQSAHQIIAIIKVMAQLDVTEKRLPQDGRFKLENKKYHAYDFRLNTCPTIYGEKAVVRILNSSHHTLSIDMLGLENLQKKIFLEAMSKPQGMILVTGPTGSGKTVTLYTALSLLNNNKINISTVENPVEVYLTGTNQININQKIGLNFATVLRALLRQDPDVIMVGEIRDIETAEIALQAAQTGHMVLSTLHTNNAAETLSRLISMGIPHYNIAASLSLIIAQRLVRRLCIHCKKAISLPENILKELDILKHHFSIINLYAPQGCEQCQNGYKGRIGIFELLPVTSLINRMILEKDHPITIAQQAQQEGMHSLRVMGLQKVCEGLTSLQELDRVVKE